MSITKFKMNIRNKKSSDLGTHGYLDVLILASLLLRDAVAVVLAAEAGVLVFTFTLGSDCDSVASPDLEFGRDPFPV